MLSLKGIVVNFSLGARSTFRALEGGSKGREVSDIRVASCEDRAERIDATSGSQVLMERGGRGTRTRTRYNPKMIQDREQKSGGG